jgi:SPP1 family predicted phage head-tail adaptor
MRTGSLRHKVIVEDLTTVSPDTWGAGEKTWATLYTLHSAIWPIRGTESLEQMKLEGKVTHRFRIRYFSGITPKHRIKWGSRYFNIKSVINPDERNIYLEIFAEEIV